MRYRKTVAVEAHQYDGDFIDSTGKRYAPKWIFEALDNKVMYFEKHVGLIIRTLEGNHHVSVGGYIIQGIYGELYPCKPDIFEATYEMAD